MLNSKFYRKWYKKRNTDFSEFKLEHIIPQESIIERSQKCNTSKQVAEVLSELEFVIILNKEDKKLRDNGNSNIGRETIDKALKVYKKCEINLKNIFSL